MEWMFLPYKRYADFTGRSRRLEFWMFMLFCWLVGFVGFFALLAASGPFNDAAGDAGPAFTVVGALLGLFGLGSIIPAVAVRSSMSRASSDGSSTATVAPDPSSTPRVVPAITSRRARNRPAR